MTGKLFYVGTTEYVFDLHLKSIVLDTWGLKQYKGESMVSFIVHKNVNAPQNIVHLMSMYTYASCLNCLLF